MQTLILRTIYHTKVWEIGKTGCTYEKAQLEKMILNWEPNYFDLNESSINFALGIYAEKYFKETIFGKIPFSGSNEEQIISILKPTNFEGTERIVIKDENAIEKPFAKVSFKFVSKLFNNPDKSLMLKIDDDLCKAKINSLRSTGGIVDSTYKYPLSFLLPTKTVFEILSKYNY